MPYNTKSQVNLVNDILLNILENVPEITDANVGSVFRQHVEALAIEIKLLYDALDNIYDGTRISTAIGEDLEELGLLVGKTRDEGVKSTGYVTFKRNSPTPTNFSINTSVIVSTLPNIGEEQLKFSVNQATTFLSSIDDEQHTFIDGDWDYKLNERFVHNTTDVEIIGYTTSTSIVYTFDNGVDFIIYPGYNGFLVNVESIVVIDDCESTADWNDSADAIAINDSVVHKEGDKSLMLGKSGTTTNEAYYYKTLSASKAGSNQWFVIYFNFGSEEIKNKLSKIEVTLGSGGSAANSYTFTLSRSDFESGTGWSRYRFRYNATTTTISGNPDILNINYIKVNLITNNISDTLVSGDIKMDYWIFADTLSYEGDVVRWLETTSPIDDTIFKVDYIPLSKEVLVEAENVGTKYNVNKGKITYKVTDIPNVNTVYNYSALSGGINEETDDAFRTRIQVAAQSQGKATIEAIKQSALGVSGVVSAEVDDMPLVTITSENHLFSAGQGIYQLDHEVIYHDEEPPTNITITGTAAAAPHNFYYGTDYLSIYNSDKIRLSQIQWQAAGTSPDDATLFNVAYTYNWLGHVYLYIASSDGTPTTSLVTLVSSAIDSTKAAGVQVHILSPTTIYVNITAELAPQQNYTFNDIETNVETAIYNHLNSLGIGEDVYLAKIYDIIMDVVGVENTHITLITSDVTINTSEIARSGTITLSELS